MTQTTGTEPAVSFTGAVKTFGEVRAVAGVDLEVGRGETVALLGCNGAGKSTTISLLLGLDEPDEGSVALFGGRPEESVRAGRVGAMLQETRPAIAAVLAAGGLVNGVRLDVWQWAAIAVLLWLGSLPFTLLGLGNGYRLTAQTTGVANMVCNLGLSVVGGLWFPLALFPGRLRSLSAYTPTNRFAQLGMSVAEGRAPALGAVAVLTAWLLAFGSYAVLSYRRSARTV